MNKMGTAKMQIFPSFFIFILLLILLTNKKFYIIISIPTPMV